MTAELPGTRSWRDYARLGLEEDHAGEDVTTQLLGRASNRRAEGSLRAEGRFVFAGAPLIDAIFRELDAGATIATHVEDGAWVTHGDVISTIHGRAAALLAGERTMLNYVQRLSGIATVTRRAVDLVVGTHTVVTDTRKTTPGLRGLERYAVRAGGGVNHRFALHDAVLWKDNHWELLSAANEGLADALTRAPDHVPIQVEVETEEQLREALAAGVRFLLVDNQPPDVIRKWIALAGPDVTVEASGGITPEQCDAYARAGVHRISLGALTHSPDRISVKFELTMDVS